MVICPQAGAGQALCGRFRGSGPPLSELGFVGLNGLVGFRDNGRLGAILLADRAFRCRN